MYVLYIYKIQFLLTFDRELEWAWKCSWKLIDDRCGEDVNHYIDQLHNISLRQLESQHNCDITDVGESRAVNYSLSKLGHH